MNGSTESVDDLFIIVNRSKSYSIPKSKLKATTPYFEKLFSCNLSESKKNKVKLDLDERAFSSTICLICSGLFFCDMDHVISMINVIDYLQLNESYSDRCEAYFHKNFNASYIPALIPQVTEVSKLLSSGALNDFICQHFLKIANTNLFLNYPVKTIEYICKLDLMVHSEYQIFTFIIQWIEKAKDSRNRHLFRLLKCVRWCNLPDLLLEEIKDSEFIKSADLTSIFCSPGKCNGHRSFDRTKQYYYFFIHSLHGSTKLRITVLNSKRLMLFSDDFMSDDCMPMKLPMHDKHIADIFFASINKRIRVNWVQKTFRWHSAGGRSYYSDIKKCIPHSYKRKVDRAYYLEYPDIKPSFSTCDELLKLETGGSYIYIGINKEHGICVLPSYSDRDLSKFTGLRFTAASSLSDIIYVLTSKLEFIVLNYITRSFVSGKIKISGLNFQDSILTTDSKNPILLNKSMNEIFCLNKSFKGRSMCLFIDRDDVSNSDIKIANMVAFTSTLLSKEIINFFLGLTREIN